MSCFQRITLIAFAIAAVATARLDAADRFAEQFQPFARKYCVHCHDSKTTRGELNLTRYTEARQVTADFRRWMHVIEFIRGGEMPPEDELQPTIDERRTAAEAIETILLEEARKHAGDPGVILPRRLSNTEYDRSVRDLTGVDIRPTSDFPPDPAGGEGFDNTGEALSVTPSLLKKYLAAAQHVSEHMVLKTTGITFAPFPVNSYNERKKLTEQSIIDFYQAHAVRIEDYLEAAWRHRYRGETDREVDLNQWAKRHGLSRKYLALVWETLNDTSANSGFMKEVRATWDAIPAPTDSKALPAELKDLQRTIEFWQQRLCYREEGLIRSNAGNWPIGHLDFRARTAAQRDQFDPGNLKSRTLLRLDRLKAPKDKKNASSVVLMLAVDPAFDNGDGGLVIVHRPIFSKSDNPPRNENESQKQEVVSLREVLEQHASEAARQLSFGKLPDGGEIDNDSFAVAVPASIEIPLSTEMLRQLDGKRLLADCELVGEEAELCVYIDGQVLFRDRNTPATDRWKERRPSAELLIRANSDLAKNMASSAEQFCRTFPNRFFYVDAQRGLAAGFHLVDGFFRDDRPLVEKVLNEQERRDLDGLWRELDFVTQSSETLIRGFVWFERSERHVLHDKRFDFLRSEDPKLVENELLTRFEKVYLEKMGVKLAEDKLEPKRPSGQFDLIHGFFQQIDKGLSLHREQLQTAEQQALVQLSELSAKAFRRPLRDEDEESLRTLYQDLRKRGQSVEASLRGVLTSVLMSPDFFFHYTEAPQGPGTYPLANDALASRLSYFLWSSLPDDELRSAARAGKLQNEDELMAQTRRMLQDSRIDAFAREFFGQWLRYRDYLSKDSINAPAFPGYDDELREAMFEEPVRLATYLIQQDRPVLELLNSDTTFVNGVLAKHYGSEISRQYSSLSSNPVDWHRVEGLRGLGRGGLFGMGVVLTKTSKGERTSPVKRGFWTVHHLLGQHFPPPPNDVPELPPNEKQATKTIRELIVDHTANPKCAMCHTHFDSLGMALEGFDPIGRARTHDLAGRPVDNVAVFPSGETAEGIPGLIDYIEQHRCKDFIRTLCSKFLGYALGRSVVLSDQPLLTEMETALENNDYRFSVLFEAVISSKQFRQQRGREFVAESR